MKKREPGYDLHQLILKSIHRIDFGMTYEKAKSIIAIKNIISKSSYYELCDNDIRLSKNPEEVFKNNFVNWIHYLSVSGKYYDFKTCKIKISEYMTTENGLKNLHHMSDLVSALCQMDMLFPPNELWTDYYNIPNLSSLFFLNIKKKIIV